jgi:methylenetetrahydrofolate reductase (NADPH)
MMTDIKHATFSVEVFPPKENTPVQTVLDCADMLAALQPECISVTYSAGGGGNKALTAEIAGYIENKLHIPAVAHLTCIDTDKTGITQMLDTLKQKGVKRIMALRGDLPPGAADMPQPQTRTKDFRYASDLAAFISDYGGFEIYGACYPEAHAESPDMDSDIYYTKVKTDCGVSRLVSQLFFDNAKFLTFADKARQAGITVPIIAGIMPITHISQISRMVTMSGASLPGKFTKLLAKYGDNPQALADAGIAYAKEQITELLANDVDGVHVYTMNKPFVAKRIIEDLRSLL